MRHSNQTDRFVAYWLFVVAGFVCAMILVGGATRLTDSGLSITEWKPISGALPPLSQDAWQADFDLYRQSSEYQLQNRGMTLDEFKFIFWWEWGHRQLGRLIGLVYGVPLLIFWLTGRISGRLKPRLLVLLALGGLQGFIGWWMVSSGLVDRTDVSHYRLATHLGMAFVILGLSVWYGMEALHGPPPVRKGRLLGWSHAVWAAIFVQILMGALVAGLDAGLIYNTWPGMNGEVVPSAYFGNLPWWQAPFESIAAVQYHHRLMAYAVTILVGVFAWKLYKEPQAALKPFMIALPVVVLVQVVLGITTLVHVAPLSLSLLHQGGAIILFITAGLACWTARRAI